MNIISKNLNILDYSLSLLARKRFKNIAILVVYSTVIFLLASFQLVSSALKESATRILKTVPDITVQKMSGGRQVPFRSNPRESFKTIFGIADVQDRIWGYYFDEKNGANYTIIGVKAETLSPALENGLEWGRLPQKEGEVVLSSSVAASMMLGGRKNFSLFRPDLTMKSFATVGHFAEGSGLIADDVMLMSMHDAGDLFAMQQGELSDLLIKVGNPAEIDTIAKKISSAIPGSRVITRKQIQKTYDVVFSWRSGFGSVCLLTSLFAFIILAWDRASGLSPEERKEMAILKVTGWQTNDIIVLRFWESSCLALISFLLGYSLAWLHVVYGGAVLFKPVLLGWSVLKPSYVLYPPFRLSDFLLIFTCSIIPYLVATIIPAWKSGMVRPDSVI